MKLKKMKKYGLLILIISIVLSCAQNKKNKILNSKQVSTTEKQMKELIRILNVDSKQHQEIGPKLTDNEIQEIERKIGLNLPESYKIFLKEFGNGAYWIYFNSLDDIKHFSYLKEYQKELGNTIELVGEKEIKVNTLLSLMAEDSNGGSWVWLTSENSGSGEWPLAYYSLNDKKLHYKVKNFTEWLRLLTKCKSEVIRELDIDNKLGLG
ncbi:SMI1/KNR4 family protein [Tenacibaculum halocynthiae]|uniref:SMI1/KNR4 family protein n=1 Tax=Tenacibaculum halocynthiae TaxID=1254437 RepID=UPI003D64C752